MKFIDNLEKTFPPKVRKYLYGLFAAAVPVAIAFEWITPQTAVVLLPLMLALLNVNDPTIPNDGKTAFTRAVEKEIDKPGSSVG